MICCTKYFFFNKMCNETLYGHPRTTHVGNNVFEIAILLKMSIKKLPNPGSWAPLGFSEWTT